jgi:glycosyltransferase involved in cell wall biosynthesis
MRILLGHNAYRSGAPSGEDAVFRNERVLLESKGHEVVCYERFNDTIDESGLSRKIKLALSGAWSPESYAEVSRIIAQCKPDIAHFHNTFPLISPSAYGACQDHGVPVVQTLHNYRLICPGALLQREGKPCEDCVGRSLLPALIHRCYRHSLPATGALVWMLARNRWHRTYQTLVNRYIALTRFSADRLIAGGLPGERIMVKPNFIPSTPEPGRGAGYYAAYVGRLSSEKGVHTLLEAWAGMGDFPLKIVGSGDLQDDLVKIAEDRGLPVEFLGLKSRDEVLGIIGQAKFIVIPSEWYEGFPMVALEAYACGTPIVASRIGSLAEIVKDGKTGLTFRPADAADLYEKMSFLLGNPDMLKEYRTHARALFETDFNEDRNYEMLMEVYRTAIGDFRRREKPATTG